MPEVSEPPGEQQGSVAGDAALVLVSQVIASAGYMAAVIVLARALGPTARGTVAFITVTAAITAQVAKVGLDEAAKVFAARRPADRAVVLATTLVAVAVATLVSGAVVCAVLVLVPALRPAGIGALELVILALGIFANAGSVTGFQFLMGCRLFRAYAVNRSLSPWLYAVVLAAAWIAVGLTAARAAAVWVVTAGAVPAVAMLAIAVRESGLARPSRRVLREALHFGVRVWPGSLSYLLNARVDQVITALIASEATLGIYAVAVNGSEILFYIPGAVAAALLPAMARRPGREGVDATLRAFRVVMLVTTCLLVPAAALGPLLIPIVFGSDYSRSVAPFLWLLPSALGYGAVAVFGSVLEATNYPAMSSAGNVVALGGEVALDFLLIPKYGAAGAAIAASVALLAGGVAAGLAYRSRAGFAWRELIPRSDDLRTLAGLVRRVRRWLSVAAPSVRA
jgi:O-antigen/teichoic acid export membrane protein